MTKNIKLSKLRAIADNKLDSTQTVKICSKTSIKHRGKMRNCWLPAFSSFHQSFEKRISFIVSGLDCVVKSEKAISKQSHVLMI